MCEDILNAEESLDSVEDTVREVEGCLQSIDSDVLGNLEKQQVAIGKLMNVKAT